MTNASPVSEFERVARAMLVVLALILAAAGQLMLSAVPNGLWPGLTLSAMALLLFVGSNLRRPLAWTMALTTRLSLSLRSRPNDLSQRCRWSDRLGCQSASSITLAHESALLIPFRSAFCRVNTFPRKGATTFRCCFSIGKRGIPSWAFFLIPSSR